MGEKNIERLAGELRHHQCRGTRRRLLLALISAYLPVPAISIGQDKMGLPRIGILHTGTVTEPSTAFFMQELRKLGYVEGKNIIIELGLSAGSLARLPVLAAELVSRNVDIIYASNTPAVRAAKQATSTIPIVFAAVGEPVKSGFVTSLGRPGGNITGLANANPDLSAKRLQLLKEAFPGVSRVAVLITYEANPAGALAEIDRAAKALQVQVVTSAEIKRSADFEGVAARLYEAKADALYVAVSPLNFLNRKLLAQFAEQVRLPAIFPTREFAEAGALMSYGAKYEALYRRAAVYVDKILKGAKPADLPVELPTEFELVLNAKTAGKLGFAIPEGLLLRAAKVIE